MIPNGCFEQGPIRPPSEARSLLIRPTRNCPWNKCAFCHSYKGARFQLRPVEEIKNDIAAVRDTADRIEGISRQLGQEGHINDVVVDSIFSRGNEHRFDHTVQHVAAWLYFGAQTVFFQDADTLIMKTDDLVEILRVLRETFPTVNRVTSYCRSRTACHKSVEDLRRLREAGLSRVHIGLESGYDPLLEFMRKGVTAAEHIEGGRRIMASGISLCEFVIPGLGGSRWSREHALATAEVLNEINPDYIRPRTLLVRQGTTLYDRMTRGEFQPLGEDDIIREIRLFLEHLNGIQSRIASDHVLNLLEELEGKLPEDRARMIGTIDRYLSLSAEDRVLFRLGRRQGVYRRLDDLDDRQTYLRLKGVIERGAGNEPERLERYLYQISQCFLP
jgi:histone acetyltransferase (RNA polymerase elongator complex component)